MDRAMCQKRLAVWAANTAILLQVLGAFVAIGAMVGPFISVYVPNTPPCLGSVDNAPTLPGGTLAFAPTTYEAASNGGNNQKLIKYTDNTVVTAGGLARIDPAVANQNWQTWQVDQISCQDKFTKDNPTPGIPYSLCSDLKNAGEYGIAALLLLIAGHLLSLLAASFMTMRVCRLRSGMPGSASADSKSCLSRATTTLALNLLATLFFGAAAVVLWYGLYPLVNWYVVNLGTLRDPWNRYLVWGDYFTCYVPLTWGFGAGFYSLCIAIICAGGGLALDFLSHCCCRHTTSDGCLTNPHYWWVLPNPGAAAPGAQVELAELKGGAKAAGGGSRVGSGSGSGGSPRAAEDAVGAARAAAGAVGAARKAAGWATFVSSFL